MHRLLENEEEGVTILALRPLTNVARLLAKHPDDKAKIARMC